MSHLVLIRSNFWKSQNVEKTDIKMSHICPVWCQSGLFIANSDLPDLYISITPQWRHQYNSTKWRHRTSAGWRHHIAFYNNVTSSIYNAAEVSLTFIHFTRMPRCILTKLCLFYNLLYNKFVKRSTFILRKTVKIPQTSYWCVHDNMNF